MSFRAAIAGLLLCLPALAGAAKLPDPFERGVAAYRAGDYTTALAAFLDAQLAGWSTANLQFNLGLTYYRLHRYDEARAAFERLRQYPGYQPIADYHLGLIAAQLGQRDGAEALWQPLADAGPEQGLRYRSNAALDRLRGGKAGTDFFLAAAAGYDSDPALLDDSALRAGSSKSASFSLLGTVDSTLSHSAERDVALNAGGYWRGYDRYNGLDQTDLFAGLSRRSTVDNRQHLLRLDAGTSWIGGAHFLDTLAGSAGDDPARGTGGAAFHAQLARVQATSEFRYLQGWRLRGGAEWIARQTPRPWRIGYQLEVNDRADFDSGSQFFSHSPIRNGLNLIVPQAAPGGWEAEWSARLRYSSYRKADVFLFGTTVDTERRVDKLFQAGARLRHPMGRSTFLVIEYEYSRNVSSIPAFDYDRHLAQLGVEWFGASH